MIQIGLMAFALFYGLSTIVFRVAHSKLVGAVGIFFKKAATFIRIFSLSRSYKENNNAWNHHHHGVCLCSFTKGAGERSHLA
jgi:hypothetical protein